MSCIPLMSLVRQQLEDASDIKAANIALSDPVTIEYVTWVDQNMTWRFPMKWVNEV